MPSRQSAPSSTSADSGIVVDMSEDEDSHAMSPVGLDKEGSPEGSSHSVSEDETKVKTEDGTGSGIPVQKRRRVTRACDECRRKKIKCDGKQPCTHCAVYSYGMSTMQLCLPVLVTETHFLTPIRMHI